MTGPLLPPERVNLEPPPAREGEKRDFTGLRPEALSTTVIGTLAACPQRWQYEREMRLIPAVQPAPLAMGAGFASALEAGDPDVAWHSILGAWQRSADEHGGNPWIVLPTREEAEVQAQVAREAARAYLARYGRRERREFAMRATLRHPQTGEPHPTFDLVCRVDGWDPETGTMIEDKLVSKLPRHAGVMENRLRIDRQLTIEAYMIWRTTGAEVQRISYRVTRKTQIERRKGRRLRDGTRSGAETHEQYLRRIADEYAAKPEEYLFEFEASRRLDDFARLERELWRWAEIVEQSRQAGVWPRNTGACEQFGGCRFLPLCADEPGALHHFVRR